MNGSFVAKIRRSPAQQPAGQNTSQRIFDPTFATTEAQAVLAKYAQAAQFLAGIGLNPDTHPEHGYGPFAYPLLNGTNTTTSATNATTPVNGTRATATAATTSVNGTNATLPQFAPASLSNAGTNSDGIISLPGTEQQQLTDDFSGALDILYYGGAEFGSQAQPLTVSIDTGSADLWVPVNCRTCGGNSFVAAQSSTYKNLGTRYSITYGAGRVWGTLAQDTVGIGALAVDQQAFGAVQRESSDFFYEPADGLLGMAFGSIAQSKRPTFFENLMLTKQLAAGAFAVHLERGRATGSEVCFGCFDTTKAVGPIMWNPVTSRTYWSISMDGISSNSSTITDLNLTAAIDTGTTLIYLPAEMADEFYNQIPGASAATEYGAGFYTFPCTAPLVISLSFSGLPYRISMSDFNLGRTGAGSSDCVGGILGLGSGFPADLAIVGDEFLKSWYSIYDYAGSRVGFAPSINNRASP